jgi:hypothetical protein
VTKCLHGCDGDHGGDGRVQVPDCPSGGGSECPSPRALARQSGKIFREDLTNDEWLMTTALYLQKTLSVYNQQVKYLRQEIWVKLITMLYYPQPSFTLCTRLGLLRFARNLIEA